MGDSQASLRRSQWIVFFVCYIGYALYVLCRKAFSFASIPIMKDLDLDKSDLGLIASSQYVAYAISKFVGGIAADHVSSKLLFSSGLFLSGLTTIAFTFGGDDLSILAGIWFVSGFVQGAGWPAIGKLLRSWFKAEELGLWYSICLSALNLACSLGPILATSLIMVSSWKVHMISMGIVSIIFSLVGLLLLSDSPEAGGITTADTKGKDSPSKGEVKRGRGTWQELLKSPVMIIMCFGYFSFFALRTALSDWAQFYLSVECDQSAETGSYFISTMEAGGMLGSIAAGYLGDKAIAYFKRDETSKGSPRVWVLIAYMILTVIAVYFFLTSVDDDTSTTWIFTLAFVIGFGIYGPVALYGVMAMESAPAHICSTSASIAALAANVGAVFAGFPISSFAESYSWFHAFLLLEILSVISIGVTFILNGMEYKMIPIKKKIS